MWDWSFWLLAHFVRTGIGHKCFFVANYSGNCTNFDIPKPSSKLSQFFACLPKHRMPCNPLTFSEASQNLHTLCKKWSFIFRCSLQRYYKVLPKSCSFADVVCNYHYGSTSVSYNIYVFSRTTPKTKCIHYMMLACSWLVPMPRIVWSNAVVFNSVQYYTNRVRTRSFHVERPTPTIFEWSNVRRCNELRIKPFNNMFLLQSRCSFCRVSINIVNTQSYIVLSIFCS
jgi:hypothetical protein